MTENDDPRVGHSVELFYFGSEAPTVVSDLDDTAVRELLEQVRDGGPSFRRYRQTGRAGEHEMFVKTARVRQVRVTPPLLTDAS